MSAVWAAPVRKKIVDKNNTDVPSRRKKSPDVKAKSAPEPAPKAPTTKTPAPAPSKPVAAASRPVGPASAPTDDERLLQEMQDAVGTFDDAAKAMRDDIQSQIEHRYAARKEQIARSYEDRIRAYEVDERRRRSGAINRFEGFLKKYPRDANYTPDAMFRLAELYFERSNDDYFLAMREFEAQSKNYQAGNGPEPVQPVQHYEAAISLYQQLINQFPSYRLVDGAYYLLGYCLGEQGEDEEAVKTYQKLVELHPESRFYVEAYTRIGEYYFDANELPKAIYAYTQVLKHKDSPFYDKALYKLAWTYYRQDQFDAAVRRFTELIDFAEEQKKKTGKQGSDLRNEAVQYMGISFAEESWGGLEKVKSYFASIGGRPWAFEIYVMLGDVYFDQTKFTEANTAYEYALAAQPTNKDAPRVQDKIVQAYERQRDFEGAAKAREALSKNYTEGTAWYRANQKEPDAIAAAKELTERSLLGSAVFHHRQAQAFKEAKKVDLAKSEYGLAATAYANYLKQFPGSKNRYELTYYLADCQYYSLSFAAAALTYAAVRDDESDDRYRDASAFSVVLSRERDIQLREANKQLEPRPVLKSSERQNVPPTPKPLPPPKQDLVAACDAFVEKAAADEKVPTIAYKAAEIFYAYDHFDEARRRFRAIVEKYPTAEVARYASNLVIESYLTEKNWDAVEKFSREVLANAKVSGGQSEFQSDLLKFKLGAMFKKAELLEQKKDYEGAANEYIRLVDENPKSSFADKAINNAAVNFEKVRRFESATRLYERIPREFPNSPLADYALFRVGINSERFYDFGKAIDSYLGLVDRYPKSTHRPDALYNAALALENTQQYKRAEEQYQRYAQLFPARPDAPEVFFRSARAAFAAGEKPQAIRIYELFVQRYGGKRDQDERVVEAQLRIAELEDAIGNLPAAKKAFGATVLQSNRRNKGQAFAGKAQFEIAEMAFRDYDRIKIDGSTKNQKNAIMMRAKQLTKVREEYQRVFQYKQVEWTLAALYRIGFLYESFADTLFAAPPPPEVKKLGTDYVEEYRVLLEEQAVPLEDKAVDAYKRTIAEAKKSGVANEWTKRTLKSLNKLRKKEFPLQKEAKHVVEVASFAAPPMRDEQKINAAASLPSSQPASQPVSPPASQPLRAGAGAGAASGDAAPRGEQ